MPSRFEIFLTRSWMRDGAILLLRLWIGAMMISHGQGKIFGDFDKFTQGVTNMGFPAPEIFAWAAALSEFAGGILLILGLFMRPATIFVIFTMGVAGFIKHFSDPFSKKEPSLTYLVIAIALLIAGPGKFSLDKKLFGKENS